MIGARALLRVRDDADLRKLAAESAKRAGIAVVESAEPLVAYINHGRWIGMCACGGGVAVDPDCKVAVCFVHQVDGAADVALIHTNIVWPKDRGRIVSVLQKRTLARNRNWEPRESVADLERENVAHKVKE